MGFDKLSPNGVCIPFALSLACHAQTLLGTAGSQLFADGHAEGQWAAQGQVTQNGQTFNVYQYSGDASLQVLIDQHIVQSNVQLS